MRSTFEALKAEKNGPHKKFFLMKNFGEALRAAGVNTEELKKQGCDQIVAAIEANLKLK